jgi:hypothetical protein
MSQASAIKIIGSAMLPTDADRQADIRIGALGVAGFIALGLVGDTLFKR